MNSGYAGPLILADSALDIEDSPIASIGISNNGHIDSGSYFSSISNHLGRSCQSQVWITQPGHGRARPGHVDRWEPGLLDDFGSQAIIRSGDCNNTRLLKHLA
jgi:hypothetical protein